MASELGGRLAATIVPSDDFFVGGVVVRGDTPATLFEECIDWRAARSVLMDLIEHGQARYHAFDWEAFDGSLRDRETIVRARAVVIFEGVYSGRVELRDLVDVSVLVHVPERERLRRLLQREGEIGDWEAQWHRAEDWYFSNVITRDDYDFILDSGRLVAVDRT